MSKHSQEIPYIQIGCTLCPSHINVPGTSFIVCVNCQSKLCMNCGDEAIKNYGNKLRFISEHYCNKCDDCTSDYNESSDDDDA